MRAGFQRFWWLALAKFVTGDENASSKTPHGAYSFPLWAIFKEMSNKFKISLLENSHNFLEEALEKAVRAEKEPLQWKYAIFSLVQSIELILKERLKREHEILIYQNIDKPKNTVGLDLSIERLQKISSVNFSTYDLKAISSAKKWRNLIVHYEFEFFPKELKIVFAQLLGFSLHFNKKQFDIHLDEKVKSKAWNEALDIMDYATEIGERAQKLIEEEDIDLDFIWECPNCGFDTFVIQDDINSCYVCGYAEDVFECEECKNLFFKFDCKEYQISDEEYKQYCNECYDDKIELDEIHYHYLMEEWYRDKINKSRVGKGESHP
jgi:hypothetical protein